MLNRRPLLLKQGSMGWAHVIYTGDDCHVSYTTLRAAGLRKCCLVYCPEFICHTIVDLKATVRVLCWTLCFHAKTLPNHRLLKDFTKDFTKLSKGLVKHVRDILGVYETALVGGGDLLAGRTFQRGRYARTPQPAASAHSSIQFRFMVPTRSMSPRGGQAHGHVAREAGARASPPPCVCAARVGALLCARDVMR